MALLIVLLISLIDPIRLALTFFCSLILQSPWFIPFAALIAEIIYTLAWAMFAFRLPTLSSFLAGFLVCLVQATLWYFGLRQRRRRKEAKQKATD